MMNPVRATAGWLAGRVLLFLAILAALVVWDAYRDESRLMGAMLKGLVPDKEVVESLQQVRERIEALSDHATKEANQRLSEARDWAPAAIDDAIRRLKVEIKAREDKRPTSTLRTFALMTGQGLRDDLENEVLIQVRKAELGALNRLKLNLDEIRVARRNAEQDFEQKRIRTLDTWAKYMTKEAERLRFIRDNKYKLWLPNSNARHQAAKLRLEVNQLARDYNAAGKQFFAARDRLNKARAPGQTDLEQVRLASARILDPLDALIADKRAAVEASEKQAEKIVQSIRSVFLKALGILVAVTLAPIGIKALWYWGVARFAERRRPVQLRPGATGMVVADITGGSGVSTQAKVSAVSQEVVIDGREELLVHPEFLQSSADHAHKRTKWLLSWHYWFMSIAAHMVFIDRIRAPDGATFVVSSKNDAFAEVGVLPLPEGAALVLQPRNLVGLVQAIDLPIRIARKWNWSLMAFITLQFRYLIFEGPGKLIVQGCRGVRVEQAGTGRSIDQAATIGFSANLDYSPRRSETFGAYLLGTRGLFNDRFAGGPGVYVYEEMPYFGKKSGITGRGLEGLTDGLLRVVGI